MSHNHPPRLIPAQVCFVVEDVAAAIEECAARFGWGPFQPFTASVPEARYRDWSGPKRTDVALGMAGAVQVELIHVHEGHDTVEAYQARYGPGFQHLGIYCRDRERALEALEALGGALDDQNEFSGIRFAFVDTPTGPGLFELLQPTGTEPPPGSDAPASDQPAAPSVTLDRATVVTDDLERALAFYAQAFGWHDLEPTPCTLRFGKQQTSLRRVRGRAGKLLLELVEPRPGGDDPYAHHLARGDHGLVHVGGIGRSGALPDGYAVEGEWLEDGESFALYDWAGGPATLQLRSASA